MAIVRPFRFMHSFRKQEFNPDYVDYVWFKSFFNEQEVEKIRGLWNPELVTDAKVTYKGGDVAKDDLRKSEVMFIKPGDNNWIYDRLEQACLQVNANRYKFEVTGFQTELQLASYGVDAFFEWHMDFAPAQSSNRKLSITVQLSGPDEYEGGELQFMINHKIFTAPREKGTAIIFPSFALHRVTKVISGNRKSIVGWIAGPPYR